MTPNQIKAFTPRFYWSKLDTSGTMTAHAFNDKIDALLHYGLCCDPWLENVRANGINFCNYISILCVFTLQRFL